MQPQWNWQQPIQKASLHNDSIGNNSGGVRSQRDDDFDFFLDSNHEKVPLNTQPIDEMKDEQRQQQQQQYGPENKTTEQKQPQISVYDIDQHLTSKTVSILNYRKTLETIVQYINAFSLQELKKFIRLVLSLPGFEGDFQGTEKENKHNGKMNIESQVMKRKDSDQVSSDISAKSEPQHPQNQSSFVLPSNGIQTILEIVSFLCSLIDKCTTLQNNHLMQLVRESAHVQSRFFLLPLKPQELISEISEFTQNSNQESKYTQVEQDLQNAYVGLFQFSNEVNSLGEIFYYLLALRCTQNSFPKQREQNKLSPKMKTHCINVLNQLQTASEKYYNMFQLEKNIPSYIIPKADLLKLSKTELQHYTNVMFGFCHRYQDKIHKYLFDIVETLLSEDVSIDKKCLGLKLVDKLTLNTKLYPQTITCTIQLLQHTMIIKRFLNDQTHSQLLRKLPPIVKFLYQLSRISISDIKQLIQSVINSHQQFFKVIMSLVQYLQLVHLEEVFHFVQLIVQKNNNLLVNGHLAGLVTSVVSNGNLVNTGKKKAPRENVNKQQKQNNHSSNNNQEEHHNNQHYLDSHPYNKQPQPHPLIYHLFTFLFHLCPEPHLQPIYTPILCRHLSLHTLPLLPILEHELTLKLTKPKHYQNYIISILQHCLKMDLDAIFTLTEKKKILQEKQETTKYQFINNLVVNCNLYDSILVMLCKKRFDKIISEKCLNILLLATKSYKPLEKSHIELLWKILGLHSTNQFEKEQFFQFIKQLLKNSINLTEQSVKHIFFQIILKLHWEWFTIKIYDCFEMLFMRLNEDGKLLTYETQGNGNANSTYHLNHTQLVGLEKFYYLYFWAEPKVSKKIKDFLYKLSTYKSSPETKQKLSYEIIQTVLSYLLRNPNSEGHILHAMYDKDYEQHIIKGFQLFSKFIDSPKQQDHTNEENMITVTIHNVTRQALPPFKKNIEVNKNMLLKEFKQLIRKEINPQIGDIQLINKGKPLKVQKMSLKELKIDNKNTILVENMDQPPIRKQSEEKKLKQSKQTLQLVFSQQYPTQLLDYIAEKYLGEQLEKICEWIMDEDRIKEIQAEFKDKKMAKIEEEKQIIPKKKYSVDHPNDYLSFGDLLAKEIDVLLRIIPEQQQEGKRAIIDRLWTVVKRLPVNVQFAKQITSEFDQEDIKFDRIFSSINPTTGNTEAYIWYIIQRVISRKSDEFKKQIASEQNLQNCIISHLEMLIQKEIYSFELYHQLIETHETILQGIAKKDNVSGGEVFSTFGLLKEDSVYSKAKQQHGLGFNPCLVIEKCNYILSKCKVSLSDSQPVLFRQINTVTHNLLHILTTNTLDQSLVDKLLSFLLFNLCKLQSTNTQCLDLFVKMEKHQLLHMLTRYKQPLLKFHFALNLLEVCNLSHEIQPQRNFTTDYSQVRDMLLQSKQSQKTITKEWMYFLLVGYVEMMQLLGKDKQHRYGDMFEHDLLRFISLLIDNHTEVGKNELIGILAIINKLLESSITNQNPHLKYRSFLTQHSPQLLSLINFLTGPFIYNLKGVPILTQHNIKQQYYQILLTLATHFSSTFLAICDKVIHFDVVKRNHDHDNIDFKKSDFVGIQNLGCTCYINSLIQQLYHTRLPYQLLTQNHEEGLFQLKHTFMQLYMSTKNAINIRPMIQQVKFYGQQIIPTIQQDVEQFLMSLLDYIESCNGRSIIDSIFGGSYSQQLTYFSQRQQGKMFKKHKQEHFYNITLDIKGKRTLNQALVYFFRSQTLDDKVHCQELDEKTTVIKRSFIKHFPKILIFTLKRFEFDMQNMIRNKLNDYLQFPLDLDLVDFSLEKFLADQEIEKNIEIENEINVNQKQKESQSHVYRLCGILIHSGSAETGHYYSYIQREQKWFEFNDRVVTEINLAEKIKSECFGGGDSKSRNAYMLFYEKVQTNNKTNNQHFTLHDSSKMEIQQYYRPQKIQVQEQLDCTLPLQDPQTQHSHHGIFLSQIPEDNFFKILVKEENNHFIKERLIYDSEYRKFVNTLVTKVKEIKDTCQKNDQEEEQQTKAKALAQRLKRLQRINQTINPQDKKPIVHFVANQMMEIQQIKEADFQEQKANNDKAIQQHKDNIFDQLLGDTPCQNNNDFI